MADNLGEFLAKHNWPLLQKIKGWQVERDSVNPDVVRLTLPARDGDRFTVRFICDAYPEKAPSVAFINSTGSASDRTAWPVGNADFHLVVKLPPDSFLCTDLTREGLQHHPEWAKLPGAWNVSKSLMHLFNYIHDDLLNSTGYTGRAK